MEEQKENIKLNKNKESNVIYGYLKKSEGKIKYVGQTCHLKERHYRHVKVDPYCEKLKEYNYPLSRGIRKYGEEEYELIILEQGFSYEDIDEKEKYYIELYDTYYNGYNQTKGGKNPNCPKYSDEIVDLCYEMLKDLTFSFEDIKLATGLSYAHISNLNTGNRRKREDIDYPIRQFDDVGVKGRKLSREQVDEIIYLLKDSPELSQKEIGDLYGVGQGCIRDINSGKINKRENENYPIRQEHQLTITVVNEIKHLLKNNLNMTMKDIYIKYGFSESTLTAINLGRIYREENEIYPLRESKKNYTKRKLSDEAIIKIIDLLKNTDLTFSAIAKQFNVYTSTISGIDKGRLYRQKEISYPIRINNK